MNWAHLPVAGGLYDQDPRLIDDWEIIFREKARYEKNKAAQEKAESDSRTRTAKQKAKRGKK